MHHHSSYRRFARLLLVVFLSSLLPGGPRPAQGSLPPATTPGAPAPQSAHYSVPPVVDPHLPSLSLHLSVAPDPVAVGETAAFTITVENGAPDPANDLLVTLPTPDEALALPGPNTISPTQGWRWSFARLDGHSSAVLTANLRLVRTPAGEALLLHPQATARGLTSPVHEIAGALVVDRTLGPATTRFTPGTPAVLHSRDGHVSVQFPAHAAPRPL